MQIEKANKENLKEICHLIKESIVNLCGDDHLNKQEHIDNWLSARSESEMDALLFGSESQAFVCADKGVVVGISHIKNNGELTLCYVHPKKLGRGIGSFILQAAENQAEEWGIKQIQLVSTATARSFYLSQGYEQYQDSIMYIGMPGYPLKKAVMLL